MLDYVMFIRRLLWNRSGGWSSPAIAIYIARRQTWSLLSGEKLSTSNLIWLCVHGFSLTLENCSWRLAALFVIGPWMLLRVPECEKQVKLSMLLYKSMLSNYRNLDVSTACGLFASCLCFLINKTTSNSETLNQNEITLIDDSLKVTYKLLNCGWSGVKCWQTVLFFVRSKLHLWKCASTEGCFICH